MTILSQVSREKLAQESFVSYSMPAETGLGSADQPHPDLTQANPFSQEMVPRSVIEDYRSFVIRCQVGTPKKQT